MKKILVRFLWLFMAGIFFVLSFGFWSRFLKNKKDD